MIIALSGKGASGKSTVAKLLAKKLNLRHYSIGDLMRELASSKSISLLELNRLAETDPSIDAWLDKKQQELGRQDNFIIDSRLAFKFIPHAIKIFLDVNDKEAARRIFSAPPRQGEQPYASVKDAIQALVKRRNSEIKRLKKYYHVNPYDKKHYDIVIDTTNLTPKQIGNAILHFLQTKVYK